MCCGYRPGFDPLRKPDRAYNVRRRWLSERGDRVPVLLLSRRWDVVTRIVGLDSGADDCPPEPFNAAEMGARLRALIRRPHRTGRDTLVVGELVADPAARAVTRGGRSIILSAREFMLLQLLARHAGTPVTRAALWDFAAQASPTPSMFSCAGSGSRSTGPSPLRFLHTVIGVGYPLQPADRGAAGSTAYRGKVRAATQLTG